MFFEKSKISFLIRASPYASLFSNGSIGACSNEKDKESDYFAMGFRLYDPEIGRFLAIDPLLDMQPSQTPYHYCFNNPTSFTDPTGLYPKKEKGDKVQAQSIYIKRYELIRSWIYEQFPEPKIYDVCAESEEYMNRVWDAESRALNSEQNYYFLFKNGISRLIWNGRPVSSSGRAGTEVGSMTYSINGVEGEIIYRYNEDQDKEKIEKKIREGLDWQCKDLLTSRELEEYFNSGRSLNVDITLSGEDIGGLFATYCMEENWSDWEFGIGVSVNDWKADDIQGGNGCNIPELELGWIYIASDFLDNNFKGHDSFIYYPNDNTIRPQHYTFNMVFGHEVGHTLDAFFIDVPIYREFSARYRTKNQWEANNHGKIFSDPYLRNFKY